MLFLTTVIKILPSTLRFPSYPEFTFKASLPGWELPQDRTFCPIQIIKVALEADPPEYKLLFHDLLAV